jgi:hypothetical protein
MLTGVALIPQTSHSFGVGDLVFVFGIVVVIVLGLVLIRKGRPVPAPDSTRVQAADCAPCQSRARTRRKPRTSNGIQTTPNHR